MCYTCSICENIAGCKSGPNRKCEKCRDIFCSKECEGKHKCPITEEERLVQEIKTKLDEWVNTNIFYDYDIKINFLQAISKLLDV